MICFSRYSLLLGAAVCALAVAAAALAFGAESEWQPYRHVTELGVSADSQAVPSDEAVVIPAQYPVAIDSMGQPVEGAIPMVAEPQGLAPLCDVSCFVNGMAADPDNPANWQWRLLPEGVIWQSYWASEHEPRIGANWFAGRDDPFLDVTLGGRVSLLRYGTEGRGRPRGFELQMEGAALPRLNLDHNWDLDAVDYRFGLPLVYGDEKWQYKFSYYHLSSHMGDEFAIRENALAQRINYSRETLVFGTSWFPLPAWRLYGEAGWAFHTDGGSQPWEFQFGIDVAEPGPTGFMGTPFIAVNGHLREELNYGGNFVAQAGWLWRGDATDVLRAGFHYFNGKSNQYQFFNQFEEQIGGGVWYDY